MSKSFGRKQELAKMSKKKPSILERSLKSKNEYVSLSCMSFLFSEMLQYSQKQVSGIEELEKRLSNFGYRVGLRGSHKE
jgi:hypothetical protein